MSYDKLIVSHKTYSDEENRTVIQNIVEHKEEPKQFLHFCGDGEFELTNPITGQIIPHRSRFPLIGAKTVVEAYTMWDAAAEEHQGNLQGEYTEMVKSEILKHKAAAGPTKEEGIKEIEELTGQKIEILGADGKAANKKDGDILRPTHSVFEERHIKKGDEDNLKG